MSTFFEDERADGRDLRGLGLEVDHLVNTGAIYLHPSLRQSRHAETIDLTPRDEPPGAVGRLIDVGFRMPLELSRTPPNSIGFRFRIRNTRKRQSVLRTPLHKPEDCRSRAGMRELA